MWIRIGVIAAVAISASACGADTASTGTDRATPTASVSPTSVDQLRDLVTSDLTAHGGWPQRKIVVRDGAVQIPVGPKDPKEYRAWARALAPRYPGAISYVYVADRPGVPSEAELEKVLAQVNAAIATTDSEEKGLSVTSHIDQFDGVVKVEYHKGITDQEFSEDAGLAGEQAR